MKLTKNLYFYPEKGMLDCNTYVIKDDISVIVDPGSAQFLSDLVSNLFKDGIDPKDILQLSEKYPFVEWAILFSKVKQGQTRYPSEAWIQDLIAKSADFSALFAAHLCGKWVRQVCKGDWSFLPEMPCDLKFFDRIQLNFHCYVKRIKDQEAFVKPLLDMDVEKFDINCQFIFQLNDLNSPLLAYATSEGLDAVPFFDLSGGAGKLPEKWPVSVDMCGYAGGLSPENLEEQLRIIDEKAQGYTWVDSESGVRTDNQFDLDKVERFLKIAEKKLYRRDV